MNKNHYAIIMAGGIGSRFWPVSTWAFPKQFHDMLGTGQTLLQRTYGRLASFIPKENILISTNEIYKNLVKTQLSGISDENLVLEPSMRNTAGYGYIQYDKADNKPSKKVLQFTEKPDYERAKQFLSEGNYLWNAGIFIWRTESVLKAFERYQPQMFALFKEGEVAYNTSEEWLFIKDNYGKAENTSVDYAIMEPSDNIYVYPVGFDWNDLGTWGSLHEKLAKDSNNNAVVNALTLFKNASDNIIRTDTNKVVIVDGIEHYIIVDTASVLMIYPKEKEQSIKELLGEVKEKFGNNLS